MDYYRKRLIKIGEILDDLAVGEMSLNKTITAICHQINEFLVHERDCHD